MTCVLGLWRNGLESGGHGVQARLQCGHLCLLLLRFDVVCTPSHLEVRPSGHISNAWITRPGQGLQTVAEATELWHVMASRAAAPE